MVSIGFGSTKAVVDSVQEAGHVHNAEVIFLCKFLYRSLYFLVRVG